MARQQRWYIHIGMHKTGTTSLQHAMWQSRRLLQHHGIEYAGFAPNHGLPLLALVWPVDRLRDRERLVRRLGVVDAASIAVLNRATRAEIRRLRASPAGTVIVSGEGLSYLDGDELLALGRELQIEPEQVRVVFYAREPTSFAAARAQQHVRSGATTVGDVDQLLPRYRQRLEPWLDTYGRGRVDLRIYDERLLEAGDLATDFFAALDLPEALRRDRTFRAEFIQRRNGSLSAAAVEALRRFNRELPPTCDGWWNSARSPRLEDQLASLHGPRFSLPPETAEAVAEAAAGDRAWLASILGRDPFPLRPSAPTGGGGRDMDGEPSLVLHLLGALNDELRRHDGPNGEAAPRAPEEEQPSWRKRTVSIVTCVLPSRADHLPATAASVIEAAAVAEARGWWVEWVLVVDGPGELPAFERLADTTVIRCSERAGTSAARNHCLAAAAGTWIFPLDADDQLLADGFVDLLTDPALDAASWVAVNRQLADGSNVRIGRPRTWTASQLEEGWCSQFPFHPDTVLVRRRLALAVGGWPGLDQDADAAFVFALADRADGVALPHDVVGHRCSERPTTASVDVPATTRMAHRYIAAVVNERRRVRGQTAIRPPLERPHPMRALPRRGARPAGSDVIILGSGRSGSSILGELFEAMPGYRYYFEPSVTELQAAPFGDVAIAAKRPRAPRSATASVGLPFLLDDILQLPGPPRLLWLVRHPLDAICSLRPGVVNDWDHSPRPPNWATLRHLPLIERCAHHWLNINRHGFDQVADRAHLVRYESLAADPIGTAGELLRLLAIPSSPEVSTAVAGWAGRVGNGKGQGSYEARIQTVWSRDDHRVRVGRWVENLNAADIDTCRRILGDVPERFGYDLSPAVLHAARQELGAHRTTVTTR